MTYEQNNGCCGITREEEVIAKILGDAFNLFLSLPVEHPMDCDEFCRAIHQCQNMVLSRAGRRQVNGERQDK